MRPQQPALVQVTSCGDLPCVEVLFVLRERSGEERQNCDEIALANLISCGKRHRVKVKAGRNAISSQHINQPALTHSLHSLQWRNATFGPVSTLLLLYSVPSL